ncbi:MAG TPA: sigma-54 dependent transcriptional regulator [Terriglobales bacterium]|nr:sigma-54 dependent transcriptional regulator [Terriglobales bacterium]
METEQLKHDIKPRRSPMNAPGALVYVVDDDRSAREGVAGLIRSAGMMAKTFASGEEFLAAPRPKLPSCLVLDVNLPGVNGLDLQKKLAKSDVQVPIIFLTGHGDIPMTVRAVKAGAVNFLTKPFDDEELLNAIRQCIMSRLEDETPFDQSLGNMVGESSEFQAVLKTLQVVAPTDATVLILGETGTGKELIARAIHNLSSRRGRAMVKLNCAAIPTGLLESELFGHEKGAFTGAIAQKIGRVELADKGTLFLDEVGDIPLELQPKLLRVLQEQEFERLGSTRTIQVDARLIVATNRNLEAMVNQRTFREDLYYRLNIFPIHVPPLRDRPSDIPLLVSFFVSKYSKRMGKRIERVPTETMRALGHWRWPGNIRELENVIERAVILSPGTTLNVPLGELRLRSGTPPSHENVQTLAVSERDIILRALREANGVIATAAVKLGLKRTTLNSKIRKLQISRSDLFAN